MRLFHKYIEEHCTALSGGFSLSSTAPMQDKNIDAFPLSVRSVGR